MNSDRKAQVTLEELLRLKRLEQPPAEFWAQFESELRAKQLAAIVEKRPWWTMSSRFFGVFSRYQLPLGAAAALAVGFAGFHEYQALAQGNSTKPLEERIASARPEDLTVPATSVEALPAAEGTVAVDSVAGSTGVAVDSMGLATDLRPANPYAAEARAIPVAAVTEGGAVSAGSLYSQPIDAVPVRNDFPSRNWASRVDSLSGRSIALNVLATRASEPAAVRNLLGPAQNLDSGLVPERAPVPEPLAQMTSPAEEGRARFLSEALPATATWEETPPPSSDRFVSHLEDDPRLYESISRYGVGSDRLSIKVKF